MPNKKAFYDTDTWAYSSSRCFKLFVVEALFVIPPFESFLPSAPSLGPPWDDRLLGVLKKKKTFLVLNHFVSLPFNLLATCVRVKKFGNWEGHVGKIRASFKNLRKWSL
jgi:hypothetical protein